MPATLARKLSTAAACAAALAGAVVLRDATTVAAPKADLRPIAHWRFDPAAAKGKTVPDEAGSLPATLAGRAELVAGPPTSAVQQPGAAGDGVVVRPKLPADAPFLPKTAFSVLAWVRVDEPTDWGGVLGCLQDNGSKEKGFLVGYNRSNFTFGLATTGADDGDGKMTYLTGRTAYERGRWYHVAAVYDGKTMTLFVNGKPDATGTEQSGPVLYAASAPLTIARYQDDDEDYPLAGAVREVVWCGHAVAPEQVAAHMAEAPGLADAPAPPAGPKWVIEPYLQFATRTAITVMGETADPSDCVVEYGTTFPPKETVKSAAPATVHELPLTNLQPDTKYFYRVTVTTPDGGSRTTKPLTFTTAVGPDDAYSFCAIGDTQANPAVTGKLAKLMWERRPHFVLHMGDVVDAGAVKRMWVEELFGPCRDLFARVPVYPAIGNHERNHANYYRYFAVPKPEYYYSFRYGNAEFFSLDTNKPVGPGSEQYQWLDKALAASDATWKVCYHHHPCYSSDDDDYGNTWTGASKLGDPNARQLVPLYEKYNVDLAMNGHVHLYERSWPLRGGKVDEKAGVVYLTTGGGGGRLESFQPTPAFFKNQGRSEFHYCYFTAHRGTLECRVFDADGRLFDSFSLRK